MAIALDTTLSPGSTTGTSFSFSFTTSGSQRLLFVAVTCPLPQTISGATYAGQVMTLIANTSVPGISGQRLYLFFKIAPTSGTNSVVITGTISSIIRAFAASYTGCDQTAVPNTYAYTSTSGAAQISGGSPFSLPITPSVSNCWAVEFCGDSTAGTISIHSGSVGTIRQQSTGFALLDSDSTLSVGTTFISVHEAATAYWGGIVAAFAPYVPAIIPPNPVYGPLGITINDVDWSDARIDPQPEYTSPINAGGSATLGLIIRPTEARAVPSEGMNVRFFDDGTSVFSGGIDRIVEEWFGTNETYHLVLTISGLEQRLDKLKIPPRGYIGKTCGYIFADLLATVAGGEGIGPGDIRDGPTIDRAYAWDSLTAALDELATTAGFYWQVDHGSFLANFRPREANVAPFTLTNSHVRWGTLSSERSRQDFRIRQLIRISPSAFAIETGLFDGDDTTTEFSLLKRVASIVSITTLANSWVRASTLWTGPSNPSDGDQVLVGSVTYTFRTAVDNTVAFEVLIGADLTESWANLAAACNVATPGDTGGLFSLPTWPNPDINGSSDGTRWTARQPGNSGNALAGHALYGGAGAVLLFGGAQVGAPSSPLKVAITGTGDSDWYYTPGESSVTSAVPLPLGTVALVQYLPLGGDVIATQNDSAQASQAAIEGTSALYTLMAEASDIADAASGLARANGILALYDEMAKVLTFTTRTSGLASGQLLTVSLTAPFDSLNGDWLIEEVNGTYTFGQPHFWYSVRAIAAGKIGTALQFWQQLANNGRGGGGAMISGGGSGNTDVTTGPIAFAW